MADLMLLLATLHRGVGAPSLLYYMVNGGVSARVAKTLSLVSMQCSRFETGEFSFPDTPSERAAMLFYLPIALTALATTLYHIAQKSIPPDVNPMVSLVVTYATSLVVCVAAVPFSPGTVVFARSLRSLNWATYVVGLSIVGVELAVLLAYRAGWRISLASVVANVATALLLVIIGVVTYREHLAARHIAGLLMCLAGLVLAARP